MSNLLVMFLIIWGFRNRASKVSEGQFFCPRCGADRSYVLQRIRRWFTLFWIPLFPTGSSKGEVVRCQTCNTAFRPDVLQTPTSAALTDSIRETMRTAAVVMLKAGNPYDPAARQAALEAIVAAGAVGFNDGHLSEDLASRDQSQLQGQLNVLVRGLNDQGKETFITRLAEIAAADGPPSDGERSVLDTAGAGLGLSAAYVLGIVTAVTTGTKPRQY
ncbi:MAG TPA: zinc-ribbon domain-containing protein [Acidimicrobiales bacterium]|nr:zinc-ribbon domain-containing protein [Acidimicrobiales bacterium]